MAIPRIFVSSTCYDLKYIRESLKYFIHNMGYEAILSDDGDVYYDVDIHTHDACLTEVSNCQLFVLIIGGRYGGKYKGSNTSITNMEYNEAIRQKIPVFTLIESDVYGQHHLYTKNKTNSTINYTAVDDTKIFEFIDEVRKSVINNAIFSFKNFADIESYLKKQWAGMMYKFLTTESESRRVSELFEQIQKATSTIERYTKVMVEKVADTDTKHILKVYNDMNSFISENKETFFISLFLQNDITVKPEEVISNKSLEEYLAYKRIKFRKYINSYAINVLDMVGISPTFRVEANCEVLSDSYDKLRKDLKTIMSKNNITVEQITGVGE